MDISKASSFRASLDFTHAVRISSIYLVGLMSGRKHTCQIGYPSYRKGVRSTAFLLLHLKLDNASS